ncbi:MAG: TonB-dependent receptor, partial [Acidobacteria bacterium]|nr:TonB-dependent receptor [Acidobacteriota bacterium]
MYGQTQATAADLSGTVVDPNGAVVAGANVTAKDNSTGLSRTAVTDSDGGYRLIGLPPGEYEVTAEAATFKRVVISPVRLTVGQAAELPIRMEIGGQDVVVNVSGDSVELVETTKSNVSTTIDQARIENLPINERSATGFALTISTVGRDNGRPVGPAPTSGLNIGGQRGRSTLIQVDGADFTDNSINAARTTVSQEAVQEYQVTTNSYLPEFGRPTGGIVNVVTRRGTNAVSGNLFGFIRDKSIQARNAFAPIIDGDPEKRPPYTRVQYGGTLGGPIVKDRMFFFFSVERQTALNGSSTLVNFLPNLGVSQGQLIGSRFLLSGAPVPLTRNAQGQLVAFRPLSQLSRIFPISEDTTYSSIRLDHRIVDGQQLSIRFGYNPSDISGIQDESQNQTLGQNDYSRTGIQRLKDSSFQASLSSVLPSNMLNEAYFNFGRRKATFDSSVPSVAHQIAGTGFIGSNPFSPVDRSETRFQLRDNLTWAAGDHTFKFGADFNWINVIAKFELNFPGLFNFSQQSCSSLITGCTGPAFTPNQTYGLGFPSVFIQGFGDPNSRIGNKPIAFFAQDSWRIVRNFTLNYGVRYDVELTEEFDPVPFRDPLTGITLTARDVQVAQDALGVTQGFPRDYNNIAPR